MSRAFVKEIERDEAIPPPESPLPPGTANVITREGAARLRAEAAALRTERAERKAAGRAEDAVRIAAIDRRLAWFERRSETWVELDPPSRPEEARFGVRVTLADPDGATRTVRIVGVDEADSARGDVSWLSPVATALLGARVGDVVTLRRPAGDEDVEVVGLG
jgi:transcription elongation factor GreB